MVAGKDPVEECEDQVEECEDQVAAAAIIRVVVADGVITGEDTVPDIIRTTTFTIRILITAICILITAIRILIMVITIQVLITMTATIQVITTPTTTRRPVEFMARARALTAAFLQVPTNVPGAMVLSAPVETQDAPAST